MRPSAASVAQILMSAVCTAPAASPVPTLKAAIPAPAWKDICPSRTIAPARPRMVRTCKHQRDQAYANILMSSLHISASGPPAHPVDRQLPEHPGHIPERHHRPQPAVHHHQADHGHGLPLCRGDGLLDPRG